jgi:aminoglycoside/choline kinase family phosphotransferase
MLDSIAESKILKVLREISLESFTEDISLVYGDLSPRRYFRVSLREGAPLSTPGNTIIIMYFDSVTPPEAEARVVKSSYDSYLEISDFFARGGMPVPGIYYSSENYHIIVIEDLGSCPLVSLAKSADSVVPLMYAEAVEGIHRIQNLNGEQDFFIYERGFDSKVYVREMSEFTDYYLHQQIPESEMRVIREAFVCLAGELIEFPKVLVHRDYHSWNLMRDMNGDLRIIDFQDALMGTRSYDLVALVHERDIDSILGDALVDSLEDDFFSRWKDTSVREHEYPRVLLQRDLKVAGRFAKVFTTRGLASYALWIPGTVRRIKKTLDILAGSDRKYIGFRNVLLPYLSDDFIRERGFMSVSAEKGGK